MRRFSALLLLLTSGCAGSVTVVPVGNNMGSTGARHAGEAGVHFFAPAPYAWITTAPPPAKDPMKTDGKRSIESAGEPEYKLEIVYLPDPSHEYLIQWNSGLFGSITPQFTIEKGWNLAGFNSTVNTGLSANLALQGQAQVTKAPGLTRGATSLVGLWKLRYDVADGVWRLGTKVFP